MEGASTAATTAAKSTSHISEIFFFTDNGIARSERSTIASGAIPILLSATTEC
ncbi:unannotated protein [freshwater metagenome]|uniref:Unannotated protein n=1 Tax=freshwater metagenome TaxID=449393 RepID=A0A6J6TZ46_9ZZZZ